MTPRRATSADPHSRRQALVACIRDCDQWRQLIDSQADPPLAAVQLAREKLRAAGHHLDSAERDGLVADGEARTLRETLALTERTVSKREAARKSRSGPAQFVNAELLAKVLRQRGA